MDVDIAYYYNSNTDANGPFGYGRTISAFLTLEVSGSPPHINLYRGNGQVDTYLEYGGTSFAPASSGLVNTLTTFTDASGPCWKETTPEGLQTVFPYLTPFDQTTSALYVADPVGNRHTFLYSGGLLSNLVDAVGRQVSFSYQSNLLSEIRDWADRRTTFQYDGAMVPGKPVLTTVIGPTGCVRQYHYEVAPSGNPRLNEIVDPNGYSTSYVYDASGRITQRKIAGAGTTNYQYSPATYTTYDPDLGLYTDGYFYVGPKTTITDPLGNISTYCLDTNYQPSFMIAADNTRTSYIYNAQQRRVALQDPLGAVSTWMYDSMGVNLVGTIDPLGNTTTMVRDAYNNVTTVIDAVGGIWTNLYAYPSSQFDTTGAKRRLQVAVNPLGQRTTYAYNGRGQMLESTDPLGNTTSYSYDEWGNLVEEQNPLGYRTSMTYDLAGNRISKTNALGQTETTSYDAANRPLTWQDALGNVTSYGYDSSGNLKVVQNSLGYRASMTYNVWDKVVEVQDEMGYRTTTIYDSLGRVIGDMEQRGFIITTVYDRTGRIRNVVDAYGRSVTHTHDSTGRLIQVENALGFKWTTVYDAASRSVAKIDPLGATTSYSYNAVGLAVSVQDALGNKTTYSYDSAHRETAIFNARGFRTTFARDAAGRVIREQNALGQISSATYDATGRMTAWRNSLGNATTSVYDPLGRVIGVVSPGGTLNSSTTYDLAGRLSSRVDGLGFRITASYDALGRPIAEQDALGNRTTFTFDGRNLLLSIRTPNGGITTNTYDERGLLRQVKNPLGIITESLGYERMHMMDSRIDGRGVSRSYNYDRIMRVSTVRNEDGTRVSYTYDAADRPLTIQEQNGTTTYTYDALGRVLTMTRPNVGTVSYGYDQVGNRVLMVDPAGGTTSVTYDALDRERYLLNPFSEQTQFNWTNADQRATTFFANGLNNGRSYDRDGNPTNDTYQFTGSPSLAVYNSGYDARGNRINVSENDARTTYIYDAKSQLVNEFRSGTGAFNISYTYDSTGNRTLQNDGGQLTTYTYDTWNRLLLRTNPDNSVTSYAYDGAGNRISETTVGQSTLYSWDNEMRMSGVTHPGGGIETFTYLLDNTVEPRARLSKGLRHKVQDSDGTRFMVWDGQNLLQELDDLHQLIAHYTGRPNTSQYLLTERTEGQSYISLRDLQGSVRAWLNWAGGNEAASVFTAFGTLRSSSGAFTTPWGLAGEWGYYFDAIDRLYVRSRYYDSSTGRWSAADPIGFNRWTWNFFNYVTNQPLIYVDPSGLVQQYPWWDPGFWNQPHIKENSLCLTYAFDDPYGDKNPHLPHSDKGAPWTCPDLIADAIENRKARHKNADDSCCDNYHKVQLWMRLKSYPSKRINGRNTEFTAPAYHWFRQDSTGFWSFKEGSHTISAVGNDGKFITDPRYMSLYARNYYDWPCRELCAPNRDYPEPLDVNQVGP